MIPSANCCRRGARMIETLQQLMQAIIGAQAACAARAHPLASRLGSERLPCYWGMPCSGCPAQPSLRLGQAKARRYIVRCCGPSASPTRVTICARSTPAPRAPVAPKSTHPHLNRCNPGEFLVSPGVAAATEAPYCWVRQWLRISAPVADHTPACAKMRSRTCSTAAILCGTPLIQGLRDSATMRPPPVTASR